MWNVEWQPIDHSLSCLIQHDCYEWNFLAILFGSVLYSAFFQPQHISSQFFHFCYIISTDLSTKIHGLKLHITFSWKSWALQWDICSGFILLLLKLRRPLYFPHHPSQFERQTGRQGLFALWCDKYCLSRRFSSFPSKVVGWTKIFAYVARNATATWTEEQEGGSAVSNHTQRMSGYSFEL